MAEKIKFIHSADLHLDSPFKGMSTLPDALYQELKSSTFVALDNLVQLAISEQVDFVLIVGDLFDQSLNSVYAEMQFLLACQKLHQVGIPLYLSFGNHDYLKSRTHTLQYPDNVHIFRSDQVECKVFYKNGQPLVGIHGFSYLERAVLENKTADYQPTEKLPYQIGMLHGSLGQSSEHDPYAPFQLGDLKSKAIDYWALGHIHQRAILHQDPAIVYPGNTQGRSSKEIGEKGCYLVELESLETKLTFKPLGSIQFDKLMIDVGDCDRLDQVFQVISDRLTHLTNQKSILFLTLMNAKDALLSSYYQGEIDELIELYNEQELEKSTWNWIQSVKLEQSVKSSKSSFETHDPFINQLISEFDTIDWSEVTKDLWQHRQAKRFLSALTEEEKYDLTAEAKNLALYHLIGLDQDEDK